jgi:hypothetical protein
MFGWASTYSRDGASVQILRYRKILEFTGAPVLIPVNTAVVKNDREFSESSERAEAAQKRRSRDPAVADFDIRALERRPGDAMRRFLLPWLARMSREGVRSSRCKCPAPARAGASARRTADLRWSDRALAPPREKRAAAPRILPLIFPSYEASRAATLMWLKSRGRPPSWSPRCRRSAPCGRGRRGRLPASCSSDWRGRSPPCAG